MPLKLIKDELEISENLWNEFAELREQMDGDFKFVYDYKNKPVFPSNEQGWEQVRYNGASVIVNKSLSLLSDAWVQLRIPMPQKSDRVNREQISLTELVAIGALYEADRNLENEVVSKRLQELKAFNTIVRGGTVSVVLMYKDKNGKIVKDIREYDPYECIWQRGRFERRYYEDTQYLKDKYGDDKIHADNDTGEPDKTLCHEIWRPGAWGLMIKDKTLEEGETQLDYIPIKVCTVGSTPVISGKNVKYSFISALTNNRDLYDKISQVLSILASRAKDSGKIKIYQLINTALGDGGIDVAELEKLGYGKKDTQQRTEIVAIDAGKGAGQPMILEPPTDNHLMHFLQVLFGMDVLGSIDPIAFGQSRQSNASGALAAELRNAALEFLNPFRLCMEESYIFDSEEIVRQFVKNKFPKDTFKGYINRKEVFREEISPKDITDKEFFECSLVFDRLRDRAQEAGIAINLKNNGLISTLEALDQYHLSDNPDRTVQMMNAELADKDPVNRYRNWAYAALDEGTEEGKQRAAYYYMMSEIYAQMLMSGEMSALAVQQDKNIDNPATAPQVQTRKIASDMSL